MSSQSQHFTAIRDQKSERDVAGIWIPFGRQYAYVYNLTTYPSPQKPGEWGLNNVVVTYQLAKECNCSMTSENPFV